jgi:hypothetical protein
MNDAKEKKETREKRLKWRKKQDIKKASKRSSTRKSGVKTENYLNPRSF